MSPSEPISSDLTRKKNRQWNSYLQSVKKHLVPFLCGLLLGPTLILLHECGHCAAGAFLGWRVKLHYAESDFNAPKGRLTQQKDLLVTSAGPLLGAVMALAGFFWLRRLREHRLAAAVGPADWLATTLLVFNTGRWFRCVTGPPSNPMPNDEAWISRGVGLPAWLLPYLLGLIALIVLIATIRLHPRGSRCLPFLSLGLGGVTGTLLWMKIVGPLLLP